MKPNIRIALLIAGSFIATAALAADDEPPLMLLRAYPAKIISTFGSSVLKIFPGGGQIKGRPAWSAEQAIGEPDSSKAGDSEAAWAPMEENKGMEWLQVGYAKPVEAAQVRIMENLSPGAVVKITGIAPDGSEVVLWTGDEPKSAAPATQVFDISSGALVKGLRIDLDTKKVPGWNEIDAVELVGRDGSRQWAQSASASSSYAGKDFADAIEYIDVVIQSSAHFYFEIRLKSGESLVEKPLETLKENLGGTIETVNGSQAIHFSRPRTNKPPRQIWAAFPSSGRIIVGSTREALESGLKRSSSDAGVKWGLHRNDPLAELVIEPRGMKEVIEDKDAPAQIKEHSQLLKLVQRLTAGLSGDAKAMHLDVSAELTDDRAANLAMRVLDGIVAELALSARNSTAPDSDKHFKLDSTDKAGISGEGWFSLNDLDELADKLKFSANGRILTANLDIDLTSDKTRKTIEAVAHRLKKPAAEKSLPAGSAVIFFSDGNFGGAAGQGLVPGDYTLAQLQAKGIQNHVASSCKIPAGWTVTIYKEDNFTGPSWTLTSDTVDFAPIEGLNDSMSSCRITKGK